jgi:hypothetical protein
MVLKLFNRMHWSNFDIHPRRGRWRLLAAFYRVLLELAFRRPCGAVALPWKRYGEERRKKLKHHRGTKRALVSNLVHEVLVGTSSKSVCIRTYNTALDRRSPWLVLPSLTNQLFGTFFFFCFCGCHRTTHNDDDDKQINIIYYLHHHVIG